MTAHPVSLTLSHKDGTEETVNAALLVVACDPRKLDRVCDYTDKERSVFKDLVNYTFHTTLIRVSVPKQGSPFGVILDPEAIEKMSGRLCGFRNETAKQFSLTPRIRCRRIL